MIPAPHILYCHCASARLLPVETREAALRALCLSGLPFDAVPDLCGLSARRDPILHRVAAAGRIVVAACHPRAVRWLFVAAGAGLPAEAARLLNLRTETAEAVCAALREIAPGETSLPPRDFQTLWDQLESASASPDGWTPWAPVIDYDRCTGCLQCLSFCLFGVYAVGSDSRIEVRSPQQCKTGCPACARVCPEAAILFPKHEAEAISGGMDAGAHEAMKVDLSAMLGGDLYSRLRERNPRFSKERDPALALQERQKFLSAAAGDPAPEAAAQAGGTRIPPAPSPEKPQ